MTMTAPPPQQIPMPPATELATITFHWLSGEPEEVEIVGQPALITPTVLVVMGRDKVERAVNIQALKYWTLVKHRLAISMAA